LSFLKSFFAHFLHFWFLLPLPRSQIVHELCNYEIFQFILFLDFEDSPVIQILDALNNLLVRAISHTNNFHFKDLLEKFLQRLKSYNLRWEKNTSFQGENVHFEICNKDFFVPKYENLFWEQEKVRKKLECIFLRSVCASCAVGKKFLIFFFALKKMSIKLGANSFKTFFFWNPQKTTENERFTAEFNVESYCEVWSRFLVTCKWKSQITP